MSHLPAPIPGRKTDMIGHNIRPGMVPGGFSDVVPPADRTEEHRQRYNSHREIREAANRVLEGRVELTPGST